MIGGNGRVGVRMNGSGYVQQVLTVACLVIQLDPATFVRREGSQLMLGGHQFQFAGATNYYMLSRAVDKATRPQVAVRCTLYPGMHVAYRLLMLQPLSLPALPDCR